jgi:hypothetical protein
MPLTEQTDLPLQPINNRGLETPDFAPVPRDLLREVRDILEDTTPQPTAAEKLRYIRDLLRPFLEEA